MYTRSTATKAKKKYYVVKRGHNAGVYYSWPECQKQVAGFAGAVFKGFVTREEAEAYWGKPIAEAPKGAAAPQRNTGISIETAEKLYPAHVNPMDESLFSFDGHEVRIVYPDELTIYTDGSCLVNPNGPGGFSAVFLSTDGKELLRLTGGEPSSTNNRMELRAAYEALKLLNDGRAKKITFHTDSKYLQQAITKHWLDAWQRNGWRTSQNTPVLNKDLWMGLLRYMARHQISFQWVKGHVGTKYNELCDQLAKKEAMGFKR